MKIKLKHILNLKCSSGPTVLFPKAKQCQRQPTTYVFGEPYCSKCADVLRDMYIKFNNK